MMFIVLCVFLVIFWLWFDTRRPYNFPPGPQWWPIVGNIPTVRKKFITTGYQYMVWDDLVKDYGPIVGLKLGKQKVVLIAGNDLIKEVSVREEFEGRPDGFYWRKRAQGERLGVVFVDGPTWVEHRRFSIQHLKKLGFGRNLMEVLIEEEAIALVNWIASKEACSIDVSKMFIIPVLNILWKLTAGKRYDRNDENLSRVCNAIHESFRLLDSSGGLLNQLPFLRHLAPNMTGYSAVSKNLAITTNFLNNTIDEHKKTIQSDKDRDLIDVFLHKMETSKNVATTFTDKQLLVLCMDFLQAGSDTTSNTISFLILYMIKYQEIQNKVHDEIDAVIGKHQPHLQHRSKMPFTSAVILEIHRMASVAVVGIPHRVISDAKLSSYNIPKDTTILLLLRNMHMDKHWGDPNVFRPERFIDKDGNLVSDDWLGAFGYGRRKCIGENLAKASIFLFFVHLLQHFQILKNPLEPEGPSLQPNNGISLSTKPYKALWVPRQ